MAVLEAAMATALVGCGAASGSRPSRTAPAEVPDAPERERDDEMEMSVDGGMADVDPWGARPCLWGCPAGVRNDQGELVERELYVLRNHSETKFADWVAYEVRREWIGATADRYWKADPALSAESTLEPADYKGAYAELHTDRGHQAPLAAFTSHPAWETTNYLSNITPQRSTLNRGPWMRLEGRVRELATKEGVVFVVTGPLYEYDEPPLPGADEPHRVPSGYWKLILLEDGRMAAFIFEQETEQRYDECEAAVSLDQVEARSGYDLLPLLGEPERAPLVDARDELCGD